MSGGKCGLCGLAERAAQLDDGSVGDAGQDDAVDGEDGATVQQGDAAVVQQYDAAVEPKDGVDEQDDAAVQQVGDGARGGQVQPVRGGWLACG